MLVDSTNILSGLFFDGSERKLIRAVLDGSCTLILPEFVVREVEEKLREKFANHPDAAIARAFFATICAQGELVPESVAVGKLEEAQSLIRDADDAPVLAAALAVPLDVLVTSDSDFHALRGPVAFRILRTKEFLRELGMA